MVQGVSATAHERCSFDSANSTCESAVHENQPFKMAVQENQPFERMVQENQPFERAVQENQETSFMALRVRQNMVQGVSATAHERCSFDSANSTCTHQNGIGDSVNSTWFRRSGPGGQYSVFGIRFPGNGFQDSGPGLIQGLWVYSGPRGVYTRRSRSTCSYFGECETFHASSGCALGGLFRASEIRGVFRA